MSKRWNIIYIDCFTNLFLTLIKKLGTFYRVFNHNTHRRALFSVLCSLSCKRIKTSFATGAKFAPPAGCLCSSASRSLGPQRQNAGPTKIESFLDVRVAQPLPAVRPTPAFVLALACAVCAAHVQKETWARVVRRARSNCFGSSYFTPPSQSPAELAGAARIMFCHATRVYCHSFSVVWVN